jgi:hypothetical protein
MMAVSMQQLMLQRQHLDRKCSQPQVSQSLRIRYASAGADKKKAELLASRGYLGPQHL